MTNNFCYLILCVQNYSLVLAKRCVHTDKTLVCKNKPAWKASSKSYHDREARLDWEFIVARCAVANNSFDSFCFFALNGVFTPLTPLFELVLIKYFFKPDHGMIFDCSTFSLIFNPFNGIISYKIVVNLKQFDLIRFYTLSFHVIAC